MNSGRNAWEALRERMAASEFGQRAWAWYELATPREQLALQIMSCLLGFLLLFLAVLWPLHDFNRAAQDRYRQELDTLAWMNANRHLVSSDRPLASDQPLLTIATSTAATLSLDIRRYEPAGESGLNLWLEDASFRKIVLWLEILEREHGVLAPEFVIRRSQAPGLVDVRMVLAG